MLAQSLLIVYPMCPTGILVQMPVICCVSGNSRRVNSADRLPECNS